MEAKLHFTTSITNQVNDSFVGFVTVSLCFILQVALLMFLGQSGPHRGGSDYLAISFIKGYVLLTWDLGAGPRRIFTPRPVDERINVHSVHIGRSVPLSCLLGSANPLFQGKVGEVYYRRNC